jgi:hypothetical protein
MALLPSSTADRVIQSFEGQTETLLDEAAATGASDAVELKTRSKTLQVFGTFVGTVHLEGSMDDTNYQSLGNVTAAGKISNDEPWKYVRANVSAYTSGAITAILGY